MPLNDASRKLQLQLQDAHQHVHDLQIRCESLMLENERAREGTAAGRNEGQLDAILQQLAELKSQVGGCVWVDVWVDVWVGVSGCRDEVVCEGV
jgi:hypothetical protein